MRKPPEVQGKPLTQEKIVIPGDPEFEIS